MRRKQRQILYEICERVKKQLLTKQIEALWKNLSEQQKQTIKQELEKEGLTIQQLKQKIVETLAR